MKKINRNFIDYMLSPLIGGADIDEDIIKYGDLDSNDESVMKELIKSILKPEFDRRQDVFKTEAKYALAYYLTTNKIDFCRLLDSNLLPIDTPENPKQFFIWLWEIFFPNSDYHLDNIQEFVELDDANEPLQLLKQHP